MPKISRILVTGSSGQLGQSLNKLASDNPQYDFTFAQRADIDLSNEANITAYFQAHQFDVIINCAAHTAVDKAEAEAALADQLNHLAVKQMAEIAKQQGSKLIHISTDYVFNGENHTPYVETDDVAPQGVYGDTKLKGEQALLKVMPKNAMVIRTSWVYSEFGNNFVETMLRLGQERECLNVIFDQVGTPTYARDLASAIMTIIEHAAFKDNDFNSEILHFSNEGVTSWYDFSQTIFELSDIDCAVTPIETKDYPTPATRPHFSVLNKAKIKRRYELTIPYWKESLKHCLKVIQG